VSIQLLCRKVANTQIFMDTGECISVTVLEAESNTVVQKKTADKDGYTALQLGFAKRRATRTSQAQAGHFRKAGVSPKQFLGECRLSEADAEAYEVGQEIKLDVFEVGQKVDVTGTSKGRGFAGTIKRHGFSRGLATHGCMNYRQPGSIGASAYPGRVFKGKRMSGHFGAERKTTKNLEVVRIDTERNLIFIKGAVPGPRGGFVQVRTARTGVQKAEVKKGGK